MKKRILPSVLLSFMLFQLTSCVKYTDPTVPLPSEETSSPSSVSSENVSSNVSEEVSSEPEPEDTFMSVSFGGDLLIHNSVYNTYRVESEADVYDFSPLLEYGMEGFFDSDLNIINMENPVDVKKDNSSISQYPQFNAPREVMNFTERLGIDTVTFCNNHIYDYKYSGFVASVENLSERFKVVGAYLSEEEYFTPCVTEVKGIKIGMLAYTDHVNGYNDSTLTPYSVRTFKVSLDSIPKMQEDVRALKEAGAELIIVSLHWGSEYRDNPTETQKQIARALCESGADVIAGSHSHCVQPIEKYSYVNEDGEEKTSVIMYSLGNFLADQTTLQSMENYGAGYAKTQNGMKVTLNIKKDGVTGEVTIENGEYVPTFLLRGRKSNGRYPYYFIESGKYAFTDTRPEFLKTDAEWQKCKNSYNSVCSTVGNDIPPRTYTAERNDENA